MAGLTASREWKRVFTKQHLEVLFEKKIKGKSSAGLDWVSAEQFERTLDNSIDIILHKCNAGNYVFTRYREMLLSKGANKPPRCISIPTVRDKLVFAALNEVLTNVYGTSAVAQMPQTIIEEITEALKNPHFDSFIKTDIKTFYASIDHDILLKQLHKKVRKTAICELVRKAIRTSTGQPNALAPSTPRTEGVPEGLAISNVLANVYMQPIDSKYHGMIDCIYWRYVDDILILTSRENAERIKDGLSSDAAAISLILSEEKTLLGNTKDGFEFLGYRISPYSVSVRRSSIINLERTIESIFRSHHNAKTPNAEYLQWKIDLKVTGFILDNHKYGWIFFYSQIDDLSCLAHLDWLIGVLCERFGIKDLQFKSFMKAYHEISKALHSTNYIPNLDQMTIEEKRHIVQDVYNENIKGADDAFVGMQFRKLMSKEIRDIQKDVQPFS